MDRWLQSFTSFCDWTVSGVSNCCTPGSNFQTELKVINVPTSPQSNTKYASTLPLYTARKTTSESARIQTTIPFASAGCRDVTNHFHYSESPPYRHERPPAAIHIHTFNCPSQSASGGYADAVPALAAATFGAAADHGAVREHCFGGGARRTLLPQTDTVPNGAPANSDGGGGCGEELAIHRAAARGVAKVLRFIIRCRRPPQSSHPLLPTRP